MKDEKPKIKPQITIGTMKPNSTTEIQHYKEYSEEIPDNIQNMSVQDLRAFAAGQQAANVQRQDVILILQRPGKRIKSGYQPNRITRQKIGELIRLRREYIENTRHDPTKKEIPGMCQLCAQLHLDTRTLEKADPMLYHNWNDPEYPPGA